MVDTHCHFDMFQSPEDFIHEQEIQGNVVIGMTNLPSHFVMGRSFVQQYKRIRLALGYHPLYAAKRDEIDLFVKQSRYTSYIGEIGLDFSKDGYATKNEQLVLINQLLTSIDTSKKILSVHSRKAEKELLCCLRKYNIRNAIFHWYSGPISLIDDIIDTGYYFSINESMTMSKKGREIIRSIPRERILTETDAPYNIHSSLSKTYEYLRDVGVDANRNFNQLINRIR